MEIQDSWAALLGDIVNGATGRSVIDRAATMEGEPSIGSARRHLLEVWGEYEGPVSGGVFRCGNSGGFGVHGNHHGPFLSHVCGTTSEEQRLVLHNLAIEAEVARIVYSRIIKLGDQAIDDIPRIGNMAIGGGLGRAMFHAMCKYYVSLSDAAKGSLDLV